MIFYNYRNRSQSIMQSGRSMAGVFINLKYFQHAFLYSLQFLQRRLKYCQYYRDILKCQCLSMNTAMSLFNSLVYFPYAPTRPGTVFQSFCTICAQTRTKKTVYFVFSKCLLIKSKIYHLSCQSNFLQLYVLVQILQNNSFAVDRREETQFLLPANFLSKYSRGLSL